MAGTATAIASYAGSAAGAATIVSGVTAVVGIAGSMEQRKDAKNAARSSAEANARIQAEQKAQATAKAQAEQRQVVREQRIRQARVMQAGENGGTAGSTGEFGALGSIATQGNTQLGASAGGLASTMRMSGNAQDSANFNFQAQDAMNQAGNFDRLTGYAGSIFRTAASVAPPIAGTTPQPTYGSFTNNPIG